MLKSDSEVVRDLRESVERVWSTARRLGLMRLDRPVRRLLRDLVVKTAKPVKMKRRR